MPFEMFNFKESSKLWTFLWVVATFALNQFPHIKIKPLPQVRRSNLILILWLLRWFQIEWYCISSLGKGKVGKFLIWALTFASLAFFVYRDVGVYPMGVIKQRENKWRCHIAHAVFSTIFLPFSLAYRSTRKWPTIV